ncbi:MAG: T9SS type A sorting domain-containing protein [Saprospiraceae bacterium]
MKKVNNSNTIIMNPLKVSMIEISKAMLLIMLSLLLSSSLKLNGQTLTARFATDTSVCKNATMVIYDVNSPGPWIFSLSGGGTIVTSTATSVIVNWGNVAGTYTVFATSGSTILSRIVEVESTGSLACDDLINLSLDGNCSAVITPGIMLEGSDYPDDSYSVKVYDESNNLIPGGLIDRTYLGKKLKAQITHLCSGVNCWGYVFIEDKYVPNLLCRNDTPRVNCNTDLRPEAIGIGFPLPRTAIATPIIGKPGCYTVRNFDLCCDVELCYYDIYTKNGCNVDPYAQYERFWTAKDCKGNTTNCKELFYIDQGTFNTLVCPPSYDGLARPYLQCDSIKYPFGPYPSGWNALANGNPSPYDYINDRGQLIWPGTGFPTGINCDNFAVTYRDLKIPVCGNSFKIFRSWKIYDWCSGRLIECTQLIKVEDNKPPIIACRGNYMVFPTDYYSCTGTAIVSGPEFISDCSPYKLEVSYKKADASGNPEQGDFRTDGITTLPDGRVSISGLLQDTSWVRYTVIDACGNSTHCTVEVIIEDNLKPIAVCDETTVVTLGDGITKVFAASFNQGSFDNCSLDSMFVRRMTDNCNIVGNTSFGNTVSFCCEDVANSPIQVVLRVKDKKGNTNECMVLVTVQDKIAPVITCPPNITVNCTVNIFDLSVTGRPVASDNCGNPTVTYKDDSTGFRCTNGLITRHWKVIDGGGRFALCDQLITIRDTNPLVAGQITWPANISLPGCLLSDADPSRAGKPTWPAKPCATIIAGFEDEKFYNIDNSCIKIIRHWKVIDWCSYDVNSPGSPGLFTRDQIIKITNSGKPTINPITCASLTVSSNSSDCSAPVELIGYATDDCTDSTLLTWNFAIDLDNNNSIEVNGLTRNASGNYRGGTHRIRWTVTDACGNSSTCDKLFTVRDGKAPTPFCRAGLITVVMATNGSVTVKAKDFNEKSEDNCTLQNQLKYSFSANVNDSTRTYTCADIPNGVTRDTMIRVYVTDLSGNQEFCITTLTLQDNAGNACPNKVGGVISGLVNANQSEALKNAVIEIRQSTSKISEVSTPDIGIYTFVDIPEGADYIVKPEKNDDALNGLSTADIVMIQKHILGKEIFNTPYKYIAADLNNSKSITSADIAELRKLILGIKTTMSGTQKSWRFIAMPLQFEDPTNPWLGGWKEEVNIINLRGTSYDNNFYGVKIGDINGSAKTNLFNTAQTRTAGNIYFEIENQDFNTTEKVNVPVYGTWENGILGFQIAWKVDSRKIEISDFIPGSIDINHVNFNLNTTLDGVVNMSWSSEKPVFATSEPLFYIVVKANYGNFNSAKSFTTSSELMQTEAYDEKLNSLNIELRIRNSKQLLNAFELFQNNPNPFSESTNISFRSSEQADVVLKIQDVSGKVLSIKNVKALIGMNHVVFTQSELNGLTGVYYYTLETPSFVTTKKMVLTR